MGKLFGTKEFYKNTMHIAVPIVLQNLITAFVAMLDNIMVGRLGTAPMSGVAIVNQLIFVFNVVIFGALSGAGIFCAQFFGKKDIEGVHHCFRFKGYAALIVCMVAFGIFIHSGDSLISLYLHDSGNTSALKETLSYAQSYLNIMLLGLVPFSITQIYASTLRECGHMRLPMFAGIAAVITNTVLNYILIFGKLGFPALGADGAAIATVISRFIECGITVIVTHIKKAEYPYAVGFYKSPKIPLRTTKLIFAKGTLLFINEFLWATGTATLSQCYSYRGLDAVAAINITSTISNLFGIVFHAMGSVVAIIIGQLLGAGKKEEAIDTNTKLITLAVIASTAIAIVMACFSGLFPMAYNTEPSVRTLATYFILTNALILPVQTFCFTGYFTIRAGGKTGTALTVDSGFMYLVAIPLAFSLSRFTGLPAAPLYLLVQSTEFVKSIFTFIFLKQKKWVKNIVENI